MNNQLTVKDIQHGLWAEMVQQQINSGLSIREWCELNNITTKTFYYRRKHVRAEMIAANQPFFAEIVPPAPMTPSSSEDTFIPQMTVTLNGTTIGIGQNTPLELLKDVLQVVRHA